MKNYLLLIFALALSFVSCSETGDEVNKVPESTVTFDEGTEMYLEIGAEGGVVTYQFVATVGWAVESHADWISVTPNAGGPLNKLFKLSVEPNELEKKRVGYVEMRLETGETYRIDVEQAGMESIFTLIDDNTYEVSATGGKIKVKVSTNLEYDVEIPSQAQSWLSVESTRALRNETITFNIKKNTTLDDRSAKVKIVGEDGDTLQTITFKQKGEDRKFSVTASDRYNIEYEGGEIVVKVSTNVDYDVEIPEEAESWFKLASTRTVRNEELTFVVEPNDTFEERSTSFKIVPYDKTGTKTIKVTQYCLDVVFSVDKSEYLVDGDGGAVELLVTSNIDYSVVIPEDASSWITMRNTRTANTDNIVFDVVAMTEIGYRDASIKFVDKEQNERASFNIVQDSAYRVDYKTNDGKLLSTFITEGFGSAYIGNIYDPESGEGALRFDAPITTIPAQAFGLCENLTHIEIPEGVTYIGDSAFTGCSSMKEIVIPSTLVAMGKNVFVGCKGCAYINCDITGRTYSDNAISFEESGFEKIVLGQDVKQIGEYAFYNCDSLSDVNISSSVETIGYSAFQNSDKLVYLNIAEGVSTIKGSAFWGCVNLASVTLPASLTSVGGYAFSLCYNLSAVYCKPTTPPAVSDSIFTNNSSNLQIYIPKDSEREYKLTAGWSEYYDRYVLYDYANDCIDDPNHKSLKRDKWIGSWRVKSYENMIVSNDSIDFVDQESEFTISICPNPSFDDEVLIYGLSAKPNYFARAVVNNDGSMSLVSGISVGYVDSDGYEPTWLIYYELSGKRGFLAEMFVSYRFKMDGDTAVAEPASGYLEDGRYVTILSTEVYACNPSTGDIAFYTDSLPVTYRSGKFTLQRIGLEPAVMGVASNGDNSVVEAGYSISNLSSRQQDYKDVRVR